MDNGASSYRRFLDGDDKGLAEIVRDYSDGLTLYLNGIVNNISLAEDLMEETLFKIISKRPRFNAKHSFKTWLYTIGRNVAIDYLRHNARQAEASFDEVEGFVQDECDLEKLYKQSTWPQIIISKVLIITGHINGIPSVFSQLLCKSIALRCIERLCAIC